VQDFADVEFYWDASTESCLVDTLLLVGQGASLGEFSSPPLPVTNKEDDLRGGEVWCCLP